MTDRQAKAATLQFLHKDWQEEIDERLEKAEITGLDWAYEKIASAWDEFLDLYDDETTREAIVAFQALLADSDAMLA